MYDLAIIGAGPAGLTGGLYAGRAGLNAIIIDAGQCGGTMNNAPLIENYPGFDKISGLDLSKKMKEQALQYVEIKEFATIEDIEEDLTNNRFEIKVNDDIIAAKYLLIATGSVPKTLDVENIEDFSGRGISYCAVCDGGFFKGRDAIVVGGGNSAAAQALYLNRIGVNCSIVHRRNKLRCDSKLMDDLKKNNIEVYWDSELKSVNGNGRVEEAIIYNNKTLKETTLDVDAIFIAIGYTPNNAIAQKLNLFVDDMGYVKVNENMKTSNDKIYAAGDIIGGVKQIIISCGQAGEAVSHMQELLF